MQTTETHVLILRLVLAGVLGGLGVFTIEGASTSDVPAAGFLTQEEIRDKLNELYLPVGNSIVVGYKHVDRGYNVNGPFVPYEYSCPKCGNSTWYRDKILVGCETDIGKYLAWARSAVAELRALRLNICLDERTLCGVCRRELQIPDSGTIVMIPEVWPRREGPHDVFPFSIGERVDILYAPYENVFAVASSNQTYWVNAKELSEEIKSKSERLIDVRMGSGEEYAVIARVTQWAFGCRMPVDVTNGWARYQPRDTVRWPLSFWLPREALGDMTFAGEKTSRTDIYTPLWTINGKCVEMWEDDVRTLKRLLMSEHPGADNDLRMGARRLEQLLNPKVRCVEKENWRPTQQQREIFSVHSHSHTNRPSDTIEIDVDI